MVPHHLHVKLAKECLSKGKHVLLEKPLATSIEGCKELLSLAQDTDKIFMVAESATHWPEVYASVCINALHAFLTWTTYIFFRFFML